MQQPASCKQKTTPHTTPTPISPSHSSKRKETQDEDSKIVWYDIRQNMITSCRFVLLASFVSLVIAFQPSQQLRHPTASSSLPIINAGSFALNMATQDRMEGDRHVETVLFIECGKAMPSRDLSIDPIVDSHRAHVTNHLIFVVDYNRIWK